MFTSCLCHSDPGVLYRVGKSSGRREHLASALLVGQSLLLWSRRPDVFDTSPKGG